MSASEHLRLLSTADNRKGGGTLASVCLLVKWLYTETNANGSMLSGSNHPSSRVMWKALAHMANLVNVSAQRLDQASYSAPVQGLLTAVKNGQHDLVIQQEDVALPEDRAMATVIPFLTPKHVLAKPQLVCSNFKQILSPFFEAGNLNSETEELCGNEKTFVQLALFRSFVVKLASFQDCPLLHHQQTDILEISTSSADSESSGGAFYRKDAAGYPPRGQQRNSARRERNENRRRRRRQGGDRFIKKRDGGKMQEAQLREKAEGPWEELHNAPLVGMDSNVGGKFGAIGDGRRASSAPSEESRRQEGKCGFFILLL